MNKYTIIKDNVEIEVLTDSVFPHIFGKFEYVTKKVIPKQPNIYRAYNLTKFDNNDEYLENQIIVAYGYPKTAYAENGCAYTKSGKKLGNLKDLPNLLHHKITEFITNVDIPT